MKLRKGDTVRVTVGKDSGREGKIERVYNKQNKILVHDINKYKKHVKKSEEAPQGGMMELTRPISIAKVMFVCPSCKKAARLGYEIEGDKKFRVCKKCKKRITK